MPGLTHFNQHGNSHMVDVGQKPVTQRMARAEGILLMEPETLRVIKDRKIAKGDVLEVARLAGIMASKRTDELIPLCHSLGLDSCEIEFTFPNDRSLRMECCVRTTGRTGIEMEALTAVSICGLTVYDMCKAIDRSMQLTDVRLLEKSGGQSGHFIRE